MNRIKKEFSPKLFCVEIENTLVSGFQLPPLPFDTGCDGVIALKRRVRSTTDSRLFGGKRSVFPLQESTTWSASEEAVCLCMLNFLSPVCFCPFCNYVLAERTNPCYCQIMRPSVWVLLVKKNHNSNYEFGVRLRGATCTEGAPTGVMQPYLRVYFLHIVRFRWEVCGDTADTKNSFQKKECRTTPNKKISILMA